MAGRTKTRNGTCTKCGEAPALEGQSWCTRCKTAYQSGRQTTLIAQATAVGFAKGCEAMRETLAAEFARLGEVRITCSDVARAIRDSPRPGRVYTRGSTADKHQVC